MNLLIQDIVKNDAESATILIADWDREASAYVGQMELSGEIARIYQNPRSNALRISSIAIAAMMVQHANAVSLQEANYNRQVIAYGSFKLNSQLTAHPLKSIDFDSIENDLTAETDSNDTEELETIFRGLAKNWKEATGSFSLNMRRYTHPTYEVLMHMLKKEKVEDAAPLVLRELKKHPDMWFEALKEITKANPAKDSKTFDQAVEDWIAWGKKEKYIS